MTKVDEVYLCEICGNRVKVISPAGGTLVCCGQEMVLQN
jgi:superoxide reductase